MTTIALISCTKSKKSYPCQAKEMYSERSPWFQKAYEYAELIADKIYILSAKYDLLDVEKIIKPYEETLKTKSNGERRSWSNRVLHKLDKVCDLEKDNFIIIAGRDYYEHLAPHIKNLWLPLKGKGLLEWNPELTRLLHLEQTNKAKTLHDIFNNLPRLDWTKIKDIPHENGIYIMFETGETYQNMDRIVRVGSHRSQGRLKNRLLDHFTNKNKDGSIFRKNIGRVFLNLNSDPYSRTWEINMSNPKYRNKYNHLLDEKKENQLESKITKYLRENISFVCFPVDEKTERLRLEEGIIATLHGDPSFYSSKEWLGNNSPINGISRGGLWNVEGLNGCPLNAIELHRIKQFSGSSNETNMHHRTFLNKYDYKKGQKEQNFLPINNQYPQHTKPNKNSKYYKFGKYLRSLSVNYIQLNYSKIEEILGFSLPASAYKHRPWWGNGGHVQADAWLNSGWKVQTVKLGHYIEFIRK